MRRAAVILTLGSTIVALVAIVLQYLVGLYPAEGINPDAIQQRLVMLQYGGIFLALGGAALFAWSVPDRRRRLTIGSLAVLVGAFAAILAARYPDYLRPTDAKPAQTTVRDVSGDAPRDSRYVFTNDWVTTHADLWSQQLARYKGKENVRALEIGSYEGRSAIWFLENVLTHPTASITCIDVWGEAGEAIFGAQDEKTFDHNMRVYGKLEKVTKFKGFSEQTLPTLKRDSFDFIYVDGSHVSRDALVDAVFSWRLLKPGGIMIFDDYERGKLRSYLEPHLLAKMGIDAFLKVFEPYIEVMHREFQVVVRKKDGGVDLQYNRRLRDWVLSVQWALAG